MRVAIIGHREVQDKENVVVRIYETVLDLIVNQGADTFLFGGKGEFDSLCFYAVTEMQKIYSHIRTIYVSAGSEEREKSHKKFFLETYDETFYPDRVKNSRRLCYVLRNVVMIEACEVLLTYCAPNYEPPRKRRKNEPTSSIDESKKTKSGTQMAVAYAMQKNKRVINVFEQK